MSRTSLVLAAIVFCLDSSKCMEPFIVGGKPAPIEYFAHSAYLSVKIQSSIFVCGSSILNQHVLLSAAHCFEHFTRKSQVIVKAGSASKLKGSVNYASSIVVHGKYDPDLIENDIAMVYVKKALVFGPNVKRIVVMRNPPQTNIANVAGWGLTNEHRHTSSEWLQQTEQKLWTRNECRQVLKRTPVGTICGGARSAGSYAAEGDSGSALVIKGYIQVGLVSFKRPDISQSLVVYTDVAYFYDWIRKTATSLHCSQKI